MKVLVFVISVLGMIAAEAAITKAECNNKYRRGPQMKPCGRGAIPDKLMIVVDKAGMTSRQRNPRLGRLQSAALVHINHGESTPRVTVFDKVSTGKKSDTKVSSEKRYGYMWRRAKNCSSIYGTPMPWTVNIGGPIAFHSAFNPNAITGKPASAGCVRLKMHHARQLYCTIARMAEQGSKEFGLKGNALKKHLQARIEVKIMRDVNQNHNLAQYFYGNFPKPRVQNINAGAYRAAQTSSWTTTVHPANQSDDPIGALIDGTF